MCPSIQACRQAVAETASFFMFKSKGPGPPSPSDLFPVWAGFLADFGQAWQTEQRRLAKERLRAAQLRKRMLQDQARTRKVGSDGGSKLKQRFGGGGL